MKNFVIFAALCLGFASQAKTISVSIATTYVNGAEKGNKSINPGDTLLLQPGLRNAVQFANLTGNADASITIINNNGINEIKTSSMPYGISLRNCHYVKLCGWGVAGEKYGIKITEVSHEGAGLGISDKSDHIEVCGMEISNTKGPGILCKTNPDCFTDKSNYVMTGISIHHNYIHQTGTEGMYIGSTAYSGEKEKCDSQTVVKYPPVLDKVTVFKNEVSYTGWDGVQISNATHVACFENHISYDSQKDEPWQNCGLIIGGGATGKFYHNTIEHGKGFAINCFGKGLVEITGNIIIMDSASSKVAVYLSDKLADKKTHYVLTGNDIISSTLPIISIVNKLGRKADKIRKNNLHGADINKAIFYRSKEPNKH